ncbi:MAG: 16S rRNA (cytosine(1402)-N(4))-methyltransferase RsmH [bacterium]
MLLGSEVLHQPVMLREVLEILQPKPGGRYIDCTLGDGGHSKAILEASSPDGFLLAIDRDHISIERARENLSQYRDRIMIIQGNFSNLLSLVAPTGIDRFNGILFDLGVSSVQLADSERGFSFNIDAPLDMRMDEGISITACEIVNSYPLEKLIDIFWNFGEERFSRPIAKAIVEYRKKKEILSSKELADIVSKVIKRKGRIHPATKIFMALRIYINGELENLKEAIPQAISLLAPGGRLCVISYHSLEDRIVKNIFRESGEKILTQSPIKPHHEELLSNRRARSAKLRGLEKYG